MASAALCVTRIRSARSGATARMRSAVASDTEMMRVAWLSAKRIPRL
jgi:hypothetical protein